MANLTLRNIPDELMGKIKSIAAIERRSLNNEIIRALERVYKNPEKTVTQIEKLIELKKNWEIDDDFYQSVQEAISTRSFGRDVKLD